ncbi:IclR family transcriptional regulator [Marinobacterium sp. YM272]|uniref:IclR family transcriptional regulator n=1 Tax=Marinobacterium sp. YM272 TaxID=3421654 RepID=UPI003D7F50C9
MGTITKALEMLNFFSRHRPELGLSEFVKLTRRDKATVLRHLSELKENGFIEQAPNSRAYRLGPAILRLASVSEAIYPLRDRVRPIINEIAQQVGELTHVTLVQGDALSPLMYSDVKIHGTQVNYNEGELLPLHATSSGMAVLAFAESSFVDQVLAKGLQPFSSRTITDPAQLRERLAEIRDSGFAYQEKYFDNEVTSEGAPIFGASGEVIGAVSIVIPSIRQSDEKLADIRRRLCEAVVRITEAFGGSLPPEHAYKWHCLSN